MDRMIKSISVSCAEFTKAMSDFNESTYGKMEYGVWRRLKKAVEGKDKITIDVGYDCLGDIIIYIPDTPFGKFAFKPGDDSFGDFLYDYYELGEERVMPVSDNTYEDSDYMVYEPALTYRTYDTLPNNSTMTSIAELHALQDKVQTEIEKMREENRKVNTEYKQALDEAVADIGKINNENQPMKEENNNMKGFNFDFGPVNANTVRMSMYGLAVKNKSGIWVSYNAANDEIMDVEIFNFDGAKFLYKMPVAISAVQEGDVIVHAGVPMFVEQVMEKTLYAIDPVYGEKKEILLTKSPFGFNFVTKVVNFLDGAFGVNSTPDANNPFGNMWMLMAMGDGKMDVETALMMSMVSGNGTMSPQAMLPLLIAKDGGLGDKMDGLAMMLAMQAMSQPQAHVCNCGGNCGNHE